MSKRKRSPIVFVVDDDPVFNNLIMHVLKKYGISAETFHTPAEVMARVKNRTPDLCIIDLNLGSSTKGWDLIQALRESCRPELPILITSTTTDSAAIIQAIEMGANDFLLKPLNRDVLTSKLMRFVSTEELENVRSGSAHAANQTEIDVMMTVEAQILEVDEIGLKIQSKHLITRGTALTLAGSVIQEITGQDRPLLTTVASASLDPSKGLYTIYLEFDLNSALSQNVRKWLSRPIAS